VVAAANEPVGATPSLSRTFAATALVALAYYASGRLGLLLAIPPGYATAVFPASGIALAAILLYGYRMAPGILAGSFAVNLSQGFEAAAPLASLAVPLAIAIGATTQAALGAYLIRRFVGYVNVLTQELDLIRILMLGGPIACTLNATVSVLVLWLAGKLSTEVALLNWWTWWIGDCIGVLVFAPLVLVWALRPIGAWLQRQLFVTVPLVGLYAMVVAVFVFVSQREQERVEAEFRSVTAEAGAGVQKDLNAAIGALGALEGLFAASNHVEPYEFEIFATRLLQAMPGAIGVSWSERVPAAARATFERQMRREGHTGFRIVESAGGRMVPAAARAEYVVGRFLAPNAGNAMALGFDALSDPARRAALELARDTGHVAGSGGVELLQMRGETAVLAVMPVYRNGVQPASIAARRRYLEGYAVAAFPLSGLMHEVAQVARQKGLALTLHDDAASAGPSLLFRQDAPGGYPLAGGLVNEYRFSFAGRSWRLTATLPAQRLVAQRSWATWLVLAGGLLLTSLVGMLLLLGVGRAARVETLVAERTAELRRLNSDLTEEAARRRRLEGESERRAGELAESNAELQRRAEVNRQLLGSLRHSESELRRTASQLAASNRELEQFAYVASHDLKAPLRSIGSFAQLLERRNPEALSGESREFLGFIQDGIRQMQALIDDLLQLSRVDARRLDLVAVSMSHIVERACRLLTADLKAARADVQVGVLPELHADANMLVQLLQNLIGNALKFQASGNAPTVRIDAQLEGDYWHFTVRDNGIGIDPQHLQSIFLVFRRLHTTDQFPGNGIGLAICKKVVSLHGGEIWADSAPGQGATFHFTLPARAGVMPERAAA
jgi:signal transduction histidine kinase